MRLSSPSIILDVLDMRASSDFLQTHLGFNVFAESDEFVVLTHEDHQMRVIFQPHDEPGSGPASGDELSQLQIGFIVDDIDDKWSQLQHRVTIGDPIQTMEMGERYFQIKDTNGVTYRLLQWVN